MTKSLTEQWEDGKLQFGCYYVKTPTDEIKKLYCCDGESLELDDPETSMYYFYHRENGKEQVEVLAPVPSYEEWQSYDKCADMLIDVNKKWLKTIVENKKLKKQLAIATKALKKMAKDNFQCAEQALEEIELREIK